MNKLLFKVILVLASVCLSSLAASQEIMIFETQVTGSKEQPKVLSIVPWQESSEPDFFGGDVSGLEEETTASMFDPLNRASFVQEVNYIRAMKQK